MTTQNQIVSMATTHQITYQVKTDNCSCEPCTDQVKSDKTYADPPANQNLSSLSLEERNSIAIKDMCVMFDRMIKAFDDASVQMANGYASIYNTLDLIKAKYANKGEDNTDATEPPVENTNANENQSE